MPTMKRLKFGTLISIFTVIFLASTNMSGQVTHVTACITDSSQKPIEMISCAVFLSDGTAPVNVTWSNEKGEVAFSLPDNQSYFLRISYLGKKLKEHPFEIEKGALDLDLGTLEIEFDPIMLAEVTVMGDRIIRKPNSIKFNLRGTPIEHIGTLLDVLRETPRVILQDNEVTVMGKGSPALFLDGRSVRDLGEIAHLKSSEIKSIEVLTNPEGRYGVNVSSAIVITTSRKSEEVYGIDLLDKVGHRGKVTNTVNISSYFNLKNFGLRAGLNYDIGGSVHQKVEMYSYEVSGNKIKNMLNAGNDKSARKFKAFADATYSFNTQHSLNLFTSLSPLVVSKELLEGTFEHHSAENGSLSEKHKSLTRRNTSDWLLSSTYRYAGEKTSATLTGMYYGIKSSAEREINNDMDIHRMSFTEESSAQIYSVKGDLDHALTDASSLKSGFEYDHTVRNGSYTSEGVKNDRFEQKELTGYLSITGDFNDHWSYKAQMGIEKVAFKYFLDKQGSQNQSRKSLVWLPMIALSYANEDFALDLSFDKSVNKPLYSQLASNFFMSNKYLRWDGNPELSNSYAYAFSIDAAYKWVTLSLSYSRIHNGFFEVNSLLEPGSIIVKTTPMNLNGYNQVYGGLSLNHRLGKFGIMGDIGIQWQDLEYNGTKYDKPLTAYSLRLEYTFPYDIIARAGVSGHLKNGNYATGLTTGYTNLDFRLSKNWLDNKLTTQLYLTDILNTGYENILLDTNSIVREDFSKGGTRGVFFTIQYRWGKKNKGKSNITSEEMTRLLPN